MQYISFFHHGLPKSLLQSERGHDGLSFQDSTAHSYTAKYYSYEYGEEEGREMAQPVAFNRLYSCDDNVDFNIDYTF